VWTIGYGHTSGVKEGMTITQSRANAYLQADVAWAEDAVNKYMDTYKWNQNQFDALVSFTFNCGTENLKTLLRDGHRTIAEIAEKIPAYNQANGEVLPGLVRRRSEERSLFDKTATDSSDVYENPAVSAETIYTLNLRMLRRGCSGEDVRALQILLEGRNCNGNMYAPDGVFGSNTEGALKMYQEIHGLCVDGVAGPETMGSLFGLK
jgi:GH24 family phage-related lysozyme (muramidase)